MTDENGQPRPIPAIPARPYGTARLMLQIGMLAVCITALYFVVLAYQQQTALLEATKTCEITELLKTWCPTYGGFGWPQAVMIRP